MLIDLSLLLEMFSHPVEWFIDLQEDVEATRNEIRTVRKGKDNEKRKHCRSQKATESAQKLNLVSDREEQTKNLYNNNHTQTRIAETLQFILH